MDEIDSGAAREHSQGLSNEDNGIRCNQVPAMEQNVNIKTEVIEQEDNVRKLSIESEPAVSVAVNNMQCKQEPDTDVVCTGSSVVLSVRISTNDSLTPELKNTTITDDVNEDDQTGASGDLYSIHKENHDE